MADLARQLAEDRLLRDAARTLVEADIQHVKSVLAPVSPDKLEDKARDMADEARHFASEHRFGIGAIVALIVAAVAAWLFRDHLAAIVRSVLAGGEEPPAASERSAEDQQNPAENSHDR